VSLLPVADGAALRAHARALARRNRRALAGVVMLHAFAAATGLVGPVLLGRLVEAVGNGTTESYVDTVVVVLAGFMILQTCFTWAARRASFVVSEKIFAELREDFMRRVLALPLSTVERAEERRPRQAGGGGERVQGDGPDQRAAVARGQ